MLDKQMKVFQDGGMMDNSGEVVNGTEVPTGSLRSEVADDIPAKLSEGEFVLPADVVRFIGLEKLMKMRDAAKAGLARMEEIGQTGNAHEVANPDQSFAGGDEEDTSGFESEIDSIMQEVEPQFANGGLASMEAFSGTDLSKAVSNPVIDVRYFKSDDGRAMYITFYRGKPMTPIPDGFKEVTEEEARKVGKTADEKAADVETAKQAPSDSGGGQDEILPVSDSSSAKGSVGGGIQQGNVALTIANIAEQMKTMPSVIGQVAGRVLDSFVSQPMAESAMEKMAETSAAVKGNNVADTGMYTVTHSDGSVSTVSNDASIQAQDDAIFGGHMDSEGNFVSANKTGSGSSSSSSSSSGGVDASGMGGSFGAGSVSDDSSDDSYAKGGFVAKKRKQSAKKPSQKGIAAKK